MVRPIQATLSRNSSTALFGQALTGPFHAPLATNFMKPAGFAIIAIPRITPATGLKPQAPNPETTAHGLPIPSGPPTKSIPTLPSLPNFFPALNQITKAGKNDSSSPKLDFSGKPATMMAWNSTSTADKQKTSYVGLPRSGPPSTPTCMQMQSQSPKLQTSQTTKILLPFFAPKQKALKIICKNSFGTPNENSSSLFPNAMKKPMASKPTPLPSPTNQENMQEANMAEN